MKLIERLSRVEEQFLQAAAEGGDSLTIFRDLWSTLLSDVEDAVKAGDINPETMALRDSIIPRVAILSDYLLTFQTAVQTLSSALHSELEDIFARVDINDTPPITEPNHCISRHNILSQPLAKPLYPPYIAPAYNWLLKNLHNPYPSKEIRDVIAVETASDRKTIDAWFIDARKRVGWNTLRREKFSNKRSNIVDAATRCFCEGNCQRPLDEALRFDFLAVEVRARELYAEKLSESILATKLDVAVKDLTPAMKALAQGDEGCTQRKQTAQDQALRDAQAASSYPSPLHSPNGTPESLPADDPGYAKIPSTFTGRKRRLSTHASPVHPGISFSQSNKRFRSDAPNIPTTGLLSPALSLDESLPFADECSSVKTAETPGVVALKSRKRRLSDTGSQGPLKRPRSIFSGSRPHSVSDPLTSSMLSNWFESQFAAPSTLVGAEAGPSLTFDVELYDYSSAVPSTGSPPGVLEPYIYNQLLNTTTNDFHCNGLFCELDGNTTSTLYDGSPVDGSWISALDSSFNSVKTLHDTTVLVPDNVAFPHSAPTSENSESSFDWIFPLHFPHITSGSLHTLGLNDLSQDQSSRSDPYKPVFQLNGVSDSTATSLSMDIVKAAKQKRLMEMKEATRRLEAEIAASEVLPLA